MITDSETHDISGVTTARGVFNESISCLYLWIFERGEVVVKQSSYTVYMLGVLKILNYQIVHELETDDIEQDDIEKHVYHKTYK